MPDDSASFSPPAYRIGDSAPRPEDRRLLSGLGRYTDDLVLPGQLYAVMLRSAVAHADIARLDIERARRLPGVAAIYTATDLDRAGYLPLRCKLPLKNRDGSALRAPDRPILAAGRVRHVGEGIAFVVADTFQNARDAAEAIDVDWSPLDAVVRLDEATSPGAERIHASVPENTALDWEYGNAGAADRAVAEAAHVTRLRLVNNRVTASPLEPRAALAAFDASSDRYVLHVGCQGVFGLSRGLAEILNVEPDRLQVLSDDVGGSFGMKGPPYPEYALALHAARALGHPVKWRDDRSESFVADQHGRDSVVDAELALDAEGRFLAMRVRSIGNMGAWLTAMGPHIQTVNILKNLPGPYTTPLVRVEVRCVFTNTTPIGPYRGAGRPEGVYIRERLIDEAARETGRDPTALRRLNLIAPDRMPYATPSGLTYDSGEFEALLDKTLRAADWDGFEARRRKSESRGMLLGRGLSLYLEVTAPVGKEMGGLRFGTDGRVTMVTGTKNFGQGHHAAFAQIVSEKLGIPFHRIDLSQGDSLDLLHGGGTGGSRSVMSSGTALLRAADEAIAKAGIMAAHLLETAAEDLEFAEGRFRVAGTDRSAGWAEIAEFAWSDARPKGLPASPDTELVAETPPSAFPNGCHACEVEIDPATGTVTVVRYAVVDDFGTLINPMLVEGQIHGGIAQGIGQAIIENVVYDRDGQLLTGSFMDYGMPRADDMPSFDVSLHAVPATTNPLGAKGCGEAGVTGSLPAIVNAIADVLAREGAAPIDMPATPERVWRALRRAKANDHRKQDP